MTIVPLDHVGKAAAAIKKVAHAALVQVTPAAVLLLGLCLTGCASAPANRSAMPEVTEVTDWGGVATLAPAAPQRITRITLHHQGETSVPSADVVAYLRRLQQWSRLSKRWIDIPYHYVIAPDGRIYAARPVSIAGDTNTEYQPQGHALVMLMGNFEETQPSEAQLQSAVVLVAGLASRYGLGTDAIASHKDFSAQTLCPGKNFYRHLENGWFRSAVAQRLSAP